MGHENICAWLQISPGTWPPDHYTLLGLDPGESDTARIEQHVHERMELVRRYQLSHPEQATEAMNRLAQALVCLTDPVAKRACDAKLLPGPEPSPANVLQPASAANIRDPYAWLFGSGATRFSPPHLPKAGVPSIVDWSTAPPPQRFQRNGVGDSTAQETVPSEPAPTAPSAGETTRTSPGSAPVVLVSAEPATEATPEAASLRRGLGTKRALYYRIARTRQLLTVWEQAGKYLNHPKRMLKRPAQATELITHMTAIRELMRSFPPLLGQAGQPGYLVLALARQEMMVPMLQTLLPSQREALARDWQAAHSLLIEHRQFLRGELRALRRRSRWGQPGRLLWSGLVDHPGRVLLLLAISAVNLGFPNFFREFWLEEVGAFLAVAGLKLFLWWSAFRPVKLRWPVQQPTRRIPDRAKPPVRRQPNSSGA